MKGGQKEAYTSALVLDDDLLIPTSVQLCQGLITKFNLSNNSVASFTTPQEWLQRIQKTRSKDTHKYDQCQNNPTILKGNCKTKSHETGHRIEQFHSNKAFLRLINIRLLFRTPGIKWQINVTVYKCPCVWLHAKQMAHIVGLIC